MKQQNNSKLHLNVPSSLQGILDYNAKKLGISKNAYCKNVLSQNAMKDLGLLKQSNKVIQVQLNIIPDEVLDKFYNQLQEGLNK